MSLPAFMLKESFGAAVGFLAGCFTPAVGRKIKSYLSTLMGKLFVKVVAEAKTIETDVAKKL